MTLYFSIEIQDLVKKFGDVTVLYNISVKFEKGKIHGLVGRNGSGKTMLMKCICGFVPVTSGKILVNGKEIGKDIDVPENCGLIIENPGFLSEYSRYKNLKFLADIQGKIKKDDIYTLLFYIFINTAIKYLYPTFVFRISPPRLRRGKRYIFYNKSPWCLLIFSCRSNKRYSRRKKQCNFLFSSKQLIFSAI